jgi:hypothetical protein
MKNKQRKIIKNLKFDSIDSQSFVDLQIQHNEKEKKKANQTTQKHSKTKQTIDIRSTDYPEESLSVLLFLEDFVEFSHMDRRTVEAFLPGK